MCDISVCVLNNPVTVTNLMPVHCAFQRLQIQQHYVQKVIIPLLGDEDGRVRNAASLALNRYLLLICS